MRKECDYEIEDRKPTAGERAAKYVKNVVLTPVWGAAKITGIALRFSARVIHIATRIISMILVFCGILCPIMGICDFGTAVALIAGAIGVSLVPRIIYALGDGASCIGSKVSDYWSEPPKIKNDAAKYGKTFRQIEMSEQDCINAEYTVERERYLAMRRRQQEEAEEGENDEQG